MTIKIKKVAENVYEIPQEGKMLVPGVVFASPALIEKIKKDKTLEQVKNVACLPGIVEKSIAMPDAHQGYGFPVGGVAAFDLNEGIISPGGIGYDINCLTGDAKILTEFGASIPLEKFSQLKSELVVEQQNRALKKIQFKNLLKTLNTKSKKFEGKKINFLTERFSDEIFEITLNSGMKIKSTPEHPFLTKKGMKKLSSLKKNDELAVSTFEGVESSTFIDEKKAILAKVLGYMFGDGCLYKTGKKLQAALYGSKQDLKKIKQDLKRIGVNSKIYSRKRKHKIATQYGIKKFESTNHELHIHSKHFKEILLKSGVPLGNKTTQKFTLPEWIKNSSKEIKRLFLAGLFGAELSSPKTHSKTGFYAPVLSMNKITKLKDNLREFLIEISLLLEEFGIKTSKISERQEHKNRFGETTRVRLIISAQEDNLLKLYRNIGFEYNNKRQTLAEIASLYILLKKSNNEKRKNLAKKIKEYKSKGFTLKEIKKILSNQINERFIERHFYEKASQRISLDFPSFKDFCKEKLREISLYGAIFDKIEKIEKIGKKEKVYDFNIQDNHNFIANGFIVSNCGVRLLSTSLKKEEFLKKREQVLRELYKNVPSGVGRGGEFRLSDKELDEALLLGSEWALKKGYATQDDLSHTEANGRIENASPVKVSQRAKARGRNQLGTIGAGNHFLEVQEVEKIFNEEVAKVFGLEENQIVVMIHTGSRGLGHQTASDYIKKMEDKYGFSHLPDRELACAPINSQLGKDYLQAMACAANFAFLNRQLITFKVRESFKKYFPKEKIKVVYDVAHNIAKFEDFVIKGKKVKLCVHRKGATRSFGKNRKELPEDYKKIGQPVLIPGSMGTFSYVLVGTEKAREISFASTAHGAGRVLSRTFAKKNLSLEKVKKELQERNVSIIAGSQKGILEEAPEAYKDVNEVVRVSHELGIGNLVARLKPLAVMKG